MKRPWLFLIGIISVYFNSSCKEFKLSIIPVPSFTEIDTLKNNGQLTVVRTDFFLLDDQVDDLTSAKKEIEQKLKSGADSLAKRYYQYNMEFYRQSDDVNIEAIKKDPRYVREKIMISVGPTLEYLWFGGHFSKVIELRNRKVVR